MSYLLYFNNFVAKEPPLFDFVHDMILLTKGNYTELEYRITFPLNLPYDVTKYHFSLYTFSLCISLFTFTIISLLLCAECYGIQHIKTGFSGERVN